MRRWSGPVAVLMVVAVVAGLPGLVGRGEQGKRPAGAVTLVVVTPHNEQIRYEIGRAFSRWHERRYGRAVVIDWRTPGGTSDIRRVLISQYTVAAERAVAHGRPLQSVGYDVVFGGGDYEFEKYYRRVGVTVGGRHFSLTQPIRFDRSELDVEQVYGPSGCIGGNRLYDMSMRRPGRSGNPPGHWWGVVLSSFGIVYNRDVLAERNLAEPRTWSDLAGWEYFGNVALADPSHSGSIKVTYNTILVRLGWEEGLKVLRRCFANARYFTANSSRVPLDVSAGEAAAGMCIDFYGRYQAESVGGRRVGYVTPAGQSAYTSDPVAVLAGVRDDPARPDDLQAQRLTLARRFVQFLLSPQGQAVWCLPVGGRVVGPGGTVLLGPERFALRRLPVRRQMYRSPWFEQMVDRVNYYEQAERVEPAGGSYIDVIDVLLHAMCMDVHDLLRRAWSAMNRAGDPTVRSAMAEAFDALPFETVEQAREELGRGREAARLRWTRFFSRQYRRVLAMR